MQFLAFILHECMAMFSSAEYWRRRDGRRSHGQLSHATVLRYDRSAEAASALGKKRTSNTSGRCEIRHVSRWIAAVEWRSSVWQWNVPLCRSQPRWHCVTWHTARCTR